MVHNQICSNNKDHGIHKAVSQNVKDDERSPKTAFVQLGREDAEDDNAH